MPWTESAGFTESRVDGSHRSTAGAPVTRALSIVVPCYNEEECLRQLHARVTAAARKAVDENYELVLVDDGSKDATWPMIAELARTDPRVVAVRLSRNHGHQIALSAGLDICRGDLVFVVDADLQDPPELLGPMIETLRANQADVVYGKRSVRKGETKMKRATAKLFYRLLASISDGVDIPLDSGDFRLLTRRALDVLRSMPESSRFIRGMVAWVGFKQVPFEYEREERWAGNTKYPIAKMLRLAADALTGFSIAPLRLASYAGIALSLVAILLVVYALVGWLAGEAVEGWTSLMIVVLVMGSVQMFVLGVIGEYVGRLYNQAKQRPLYIVSEIAGSVAGTEEFDPIRRRNLGIVAHTLPTR
ncbi:glycosyltransferase family 2 protein [Qipengyuania sp. 6D47A]|uniref:Glycosyltransferase family 2 protein n=2 Tax=Qipengyuania qiaonensis TaxID=2867240 RepID=A0ABS7J353_9SPHN|nr:glycosyltransferase family 2 protein [Qipengyuania qiaonensis]